MGYVLRYAIVYMTCERERECVFCAALLLNQQAVASSIEIFSKKERLSFLCSTSYLHVSTICWIFWITFNKLLVPYRYLFQGCALAVSMLEFCLLFQRKNRFRESFVFFLFCYNDSWSAAAAKWSVQYLSNTLKSTKLPFRNCKNGFPTFEEKVRCILWKRCVYFMDHPYGVIFPLHSQTSLPPFHFSPFRHLKTGVISHSPLHICSTKNAVRPFYAKILWYIYVHSPGYV